MKYQQPPFVTPYVSGKPFIDSVLQFLEFAPATDLQKALP
jgi:hypothetical protein